MGKPVAERNRRDGYDLLHGMGGAGTFSDGKINFHPQVGGDLFEFMSPNQAWDLINHIESIFATYGVSVMETSDRATRELVKSAAKAGVRFLPIRQAHIGSDHLVELMQRLANDLARMGVAFRMQTRVVDVLVGEGRAQGVVLESGEVIRADAVLLAAGRVERMDTAYHQQRGAVVYNPVDVSVRVGSGYRDMTSLTCYDPKFYVRAPPMMTRCTFVSRLTDSSSRNPILKRRRCQRPLTQDRHDNAAPC